MPDDFITITVAFPERTKRRLTMVDGMVLNSTRLSGYPGFQPPNSLTHPSLAGGCLVI